MKKLLCTLMLMVLCLTCLSGCTASFTAPTRPLNRVYADMEAAGVLPKMLSVDADTVLDFFGIEVAACTESIFMISADSMLADEVVLIRVADAQTAKDYKALLDSRLEAKAAEAKGYSPEQYAIIKKGKVLQIGTDLALILSPEVDQLLEIYQR